MRSTLACLLLTATCALPAQGRLVYEGPQYFNWHPSAESLRAADLDGDGNPDLLFGETLQQVMIGINDGMGRFPFPIVLLYPPASGFFAIDAAPGDLDGDGDLDIVACWYGVIGNIATSDPGRQHPSDNRRRLGPGHDEKPRCSLHP